MNRMKLQSARHMRGVTLIELMIVVVVVAILAAVAYPSFLDQVRKTRRADGKAMLLQTSQQLERCYTRVSRYDGCGIAFPIASDEAFYSVSAPTLTPNTFVLNAAPQGDQTADTRCGALQLTSAGQQGSLGGVTDTANCW